MARQDIFLGIQRRNSRLEAFLKKTLNADCFQHIRTYDSCIVCSSKENKAFKFIIIIDDVICLSENPAKVLIDVIHMEDVTSIKLDDTPAPFLSGQEQDNAHHIQIKYFCELLNQNRKKQDDFNFDESLEKHILLNDELFYIYSNLTDIHTAALSFTAKYGIFFSSLVYKEMHLATGNAFDGVDVARNKNSMIEITDDNGNNKKSNKKSLTKAIKSISNSKVRAKEEPLKREIILKEEIADVYIIKNSSRIYYFLKSAWESYNIRRASQLVLQKSFIISKKIFISERMEFLFDEMKNDLVTKKLNIEEKFSLILELKNAIINNFVIKRLFWKTDELFNLLITDYVNYQEIIQDDVKLKLYLTGDLVTADLIELILLLLEVIELSCIESEIFPCRDEYFSAKNIYLQDFILAIVKGLQTEKIQLSNISNFKSQYFNISYKILFQLFLAAEMGSKFIFSYDWIVCIFKDQSKYLFSFIDNLLHCLLNDMLSDKHDISSLICVDIYKKLFVCLKFLEYDKKILKEITENYELDFRYKLKINEFNKKLPTDIKITNEISKLLYQLMKIIID